MSQENSIYKSDLRGYLKKLFTKCIAKRDGNLSGFHTGNFDWGVTNDKGCSSMDKHTHTCAI